MATKPPVEVPQGAIRLNTDSQKLEFFAQDQWWEMATDLAAITTGSSRGIFGGWNSASDNTINYVSIKTQGNAVDFGDAIQGSYEGSSGASNTRGVNCVGYNSPAGTVDTIQYITIATQGNAIDFGNTTAAERRTVGCSNQVRALFSGSQVPAWTSGQTDMITIASTGNGTDFGDTTGTGASGRGAGSATRALYIGGRYTPGADAEVVEYVTIAATGTWIDFGDLAEAGPYGSAGSNATRAVYTCDNKKIDYATISTLGNWKTFGEMTFDNPNSQEAATDSTRCVFGAGNSTSTLEYIELPTTGNATDFGDTTTTASTGWGLSNTHGGLG